MKTSRLLLALALVLALIESPLALAQTRNDASDAKGEALAAAFEAAEANADRPGDDKLTCDQLGDELISIMGDPKLQDTARKLGAPEDLVAPVEKASSGLKGLAAAHRAFQVLGFIAQVAMIAMPGVAQFGPAEIVAATESAMIEARRRQMTQAQTQLYDKSLVLIPILPQLMRAETVGSLAEDKSCEFLKELQKEHSP